MNNNDKNSDDKQRRQREEEMHVIESVFRLIRHQLQTSETIQDMATDQSDKTEYSAERRILMQVNQSGLGQGVLAGVVTFVVLRRAPHYLAKRFAAQQQQGGIAKSGYKLDQPNPFQSSASSSAKPDRPPLPFRALRFALDSVVSLVVAASTSLYFTNLNTVMDKISNIPLVEGKSIVSQEFCTPVTQEYKRLYQENPKVWNNSSNPTLKAIRGFVHNCQLRQAHEEQLRQEQGLSLSQKDYKFPSIPSPGVNRDISIDAEQMNNEKDEFGNDVNYFESNQEFFGEQEQNSVDSFEKEWADSMTSDSDRKDGGNRGF